MTSKQGFPAKDARKHTAIPFGIPVLKDWEDIMEQVQKPHNDERYFIIGNNKILITEHFKEDGKPLKSILEKVILNAGKVPENRINTA